MLRFLAVAIIAMLATTTAHADGPKGTRVQTQVQFLTVAAPNGPTDVASALTNTSSATPFAVLKGTNPHALYQALSKSFAVSNVRGGTLSAADGKPTYMVLETIGGHDNFHLNVLSNVHGDQVSFAYDLTVRDGERHIRQANELSVSSGDTVVSIGWSDGIATVTMLRPVAM